MTQRPSPSEHDNSAGSSSQDEPAFLAVGRLRRPHGLRGEIQMEVLTDFPERLVSGAALFVGPQQIPMTIQSVREHDRLLLVAFKGYTSAEKAGELRNQLVYVRAENRPPLDEGDYYHHELIGLKVVDEEGNELGVVKEILETGANDVLIVQAETGPEVLLPATDEVILNVDLAQGLIRVHLLPGLLSE